MIYVNSIHSKTSLSTRALLAAVLRPIFFAGDIVADIPRDFAFGFIGLAWLLYWVADRLQSGINLARAKTIERWNTEVAA
jgi:hypothetical protein